MRDSVQLDECVFAGCERVLDVGGWFIPDPRATHVVDYLPWETRGAKLQLAPLPGERFTKATWFEADFLRPDLSLPFPDDYFDLVLCGHTVEDLADPEPILREMARVGRRGVIECPSRLHEQTVGVRDRQSFAPGHPHHHWIVESRGDRLVLFDKRDSLAARRGTRIPLLVYERATRGGPDGVRVQHHWRGALQYDVVRGERCAVEARDCVARLNVGAGVRVADVALRSLRRARSAMRGRIREDFSWWHQALELSRPYTTIDHARTS